MGEPLAKLQLFPSVIGTDSNLTKEIKKERSVEEPLEFFYSDNPWTKLDSSIPIFDLSTFSEIL